MQNGQEQKTEKNRMRQLEGIALKLRELCEGLGLSRQVTEQVLEHDTCLEYEKMEESCRKLYSRETWEEGVRELQAACAEDPDGFRILTVMMHCLLDTYDRYQEKGISDEIFWSTMKFLTRFIDAEEKSTGAPAFRWAWWFPRQLSMQEFRVGHYEYEMIEEDGVKKISLHIPSDAVLKEGNIEIIRGFLKQYYPEYQNAQIFCDSWLLAPALQKLLPETSSILRFQKQFQVLKNDEESQGFMDWVYGSRDLKYEDLPENTTLQRNMKKYLLSGGKIGWALGVYRGEEQ